MKWAGLAALLLLRVGVLQGANPAAWTSERLASSSEELEEWPERPEAVKIVKKEEMHGNIKRCSLAAFLANELCNGLWEVSFIKYIIAMLLLILR